ncbi:MAG: hypothetical protein EBV83_07130 [Verrucomicrobia bacterium]|nr:hypothetical protein [Verrucomicrobiota bacterium]
MIKRMTSVFAALVAVASLSLADSGPDASAKDTKKMVQNNFVETAQKGVKLSGYVDAGYSYNFTGSGGNSQVNSRVQSDSAQQGDFNLYAVKIALEKALTSENKAQAGFRVDVMIGEDAKYLANPAQTYSSSYNNNAAQDSNYLFLEQAYVQLRAPVGNGWDFKIGKFASILGYEVMERPANMNITYGLLYNQFPFWYTGVLSSYKFDEYLDGKLGVANGANSDNNTTTSGGSDGVALLAGLNVTAPGGNANWSHNFEYSTASENSTGASPTAAGTATSQNALPSNVASTSTAGGAWTIIYNSWGNWSPKFANDKLLLAFDSVLGNTAGANQAGGPQNTTWWGASAYAKYQFNDWFSLASRGEYFGGDNLNKINNTTGNNNPNAGLSWWEYTITAGFNVIDNVLIRAEYRLDWGDNISGTNTGTNAGAANSSGPAHYAGAEVVYSF